MDVNREDYGPENEKTKDSADRSIIDELHINNDEAGQDIQDTE